MLKLSALCLASLVALPAPAAVAGHVAAARFDPGAAFLLRWPDHTQLSEQ